MLELRGIEFDWFAMDSVGNVAVFSTGGAGPVPAQVCATMALHSAVSDGIPVTGWGSEAVWKSYSGVGLFVYDWDERRQCYSRLAEPDQPVTAALSARVAELAPLCLPGSFQDSPSIEADDAG